MRRTPSFFADSSNPHDLTHREQHILRLLANGLSNKAIATTLCLSHQTVATHLKTLYDKLGVHNRVMAVRAGHKLGLISADEEPCTRA
jgi:DNA-binding NarL/FixJ family response regulator